MTYHGHEKEISEKDQFSYLTLDLHYTLTRSSVGGFLPNVHRLYVHRKNQLMKARTSTDNARLCYILGMLSLIPNSIRHFETFNQQRIPRFIVISNILNKCLVSSCYTQRMDICSLTAWIWVLVEIYNCLLVYLIIILNVKVTCTTLTIYINRKCI